MNGAKQKEIARRFKEACLRIENNIPECDITIYPCDMPQFPFGITLLLSQNNNDWHTCYSELFHWAMLHCTEYISKNSRAMARLGAPLSYETVVMVSVKRIGLVLPRIH